MASMMIVEARTRAKISSQVLKAINQIGEDRIITIIYDESGKLALQGSFLNKAIAYIYYKDGTGN